MLDYWPDRQAENADATVELKRSTLEDIMLGRTTAEQAVSEGRMVIAGDAARFEELLALPDTFELWYGLVTP